MNQVQIVNLALDHLGHSSQVQDLEERSNEASKAKLHFEPALLATLRDFDWAFARGYVAGTVLAADTELDLPGWSYRYQYPNSCVRLWGIVRDPSAPFTAEHKFEVMTNMGAGQSGRVVFANLEAAWLRFTRLITDPTYFDPQFTDAFSFKLASRLAMPITRKPEMLSNMLKLYDQFMVLAKVSAANEGGPDRVDELASESITIRGAIG